jgi:hypothetical protein
MVSWRTPSTRKGTLEGSEKEKMLSGELSVGDIQAFFGPLR